MQFLLALLIAIRAMGAFNPSACQSMIQTMTTDCMKGGCSGLLTTGVGSGKLVRDPKECETECRGMAEREMKRDEICSPPLPANHPDRQSNDPQSSGQNSQAAAQREAKETTEQSESAISAKEAQARNATEFSQEIQQRRSDSNKDLLQRWDNELTSGRSQDFPPDRAKWRNDLKLVNEAERAREKKEPFPAEKANQATLPAIRGNLNQFSRAQRTESTAAKDLTLLATALAELARMKSANEANETALDTNTANAVALTSSKSSTQKSFAGPSASSLENELTSERKNQLGSSVEDVSLPSTKETAGVDAGLADQTGQTTAQRSPRTALRARLRELLRKKMNLSGTEDLPDQFLGELGLPLDHFAGESGEESLAEQLNLSKEEAEIFQLAGAETDEEVRRLQAELADELALSGGVLPSESQSLFERVKAAHDACAAKRCVAPNELEIAYHL